VENKYPQVLQEIESKKVLSDELKEQLKKIIEEFAKIFKVGE